jgi:PKD repeat protein
MSQCIYGIHGMVTDKNTHEPLNATITIEDHDDAFSIVESHLPVGDYHRPIKGGTYEVTYSCRGYYPQTVTITVDDGETFIQDIQLEADGTFVPEFNADMTHVAPGESVNFIDDTWGAYLVSWEWTFEGGDPATSTSQNPSVTYHEIGSYDVTLTVTNRNGQVETITKHDYIEVSESYNMHNGTITTCNAMFYDNGGPDGNYSNRRNYTMTILPADDDHRIKVRFIEFELEDEYDYLYVYDGISTNATLIGSFTGNNVPNDVTATNGNGALTFRFSSDTGLNAKGWAAQVMCVDLEGIDEFEGLHNFKVYPNPSQGTIHVEALGETKYQLCNSLGQRILSGQFNNETQIHAENLTQGVYFLQLIGEQGIHVEKIVIEK